MMNITRHWNRLAAAGMSAGLALSVIGVGVSNADASGGVLRTRINADIRSVDPGTNRDSNTDAVVAHMVEGLVAFREDTSIGPMLAESWDVSEDGLTYTFRLGRA
jgi:peptide/nickel transport system substrate-binding protein